MCDNYTRLNNTWGNNECFIDSFRTNFDRHYISGHCPDQCEPFKCNPGCNTVVGGSVERYGEGNGDTVNMIKFPFKQNAIYYDTNDENWYPMGHLDTNIHDEWSDDAAGSCISDGDCGTNYPKCFPETCTDSRVGNISGLPCGKVAENDGGVCVSLIGGIACTATSESGCNALPANQCQWVKNTSDDMKYCAKEYNTGQCYGDIKLENISSFKNCKDGGGCPAEFSEDDPHLCCTSVAAAPTAPTTVGCMKCNSVVKGVCGGGSVYCGPPGIGNGKHQCCIYNEDQTVTCSSPPSS